jgi:hypothetical protein
MKGKAEKKKNKKKTRKRTRKRTRKHTNKQNTNVDLVPVENAHNGQQQPCE